MASHGNAAILVTVMCPPDICPWNGAAGGDGGGSSRVTQPVAAWQANVSAGFLVIPFPTFGYFGGEFFVGWGSAIIPFAMADIGKTSRNVQVNDAAPADGAALTATMSYDEVRSRLIRMVEMEALGLVADRMAVGFDTRDEAALFLHDVLYPLSIEHGVEIAARIYKRERRGRWVFTAPHTDGYPTRVSRRPVPEDAYAGMASVWHTHPSGQGPSTEDARFGPEEGIALYVSHMQGETPTLSVMDDWIPGPIRTVRLTEDDRVDSD